MEMVSRIIESGENSKINALERLCFSCQIENEVFEAIKANYNIEKPIPRSVFRTIARELERSIEQVVWYVYALVREQKIKLEPYQRGMAYTIYGKVVRYMNNNKIGTIDGYKLAKELGYSISEIRNAIYRCDEGILTVGQIDHIKDDRGRTIVTIYCRL
jgi:hypothetical protein